MPRVAGLRCVVGELVWICTGFSFGEQRVRSMSDMCPHMCEWPCLCVLLTAKSACGPVVHNMCF